MVSPTRFQILLLLSITTVTRAATIEAPNQNESGHFGYPAVAVPDISGDGIMDAVIVATQEAMSDYPSDGRAYAFDGVTGQKLYMFPARTSLDTPIGGFSSVAGIGDLNGDGSNDILIGSIATNRVFVFNGVDGSLIDTLTGSNPSTFGYALLAVPDRDGDDVPDFAVSSPVGPDETGAPSAGVVFLYSGATREHLATLHRPATNSDGSNFGGSLAWGRFSADGSECLAVGDSGLDYFTELGSISSAGGVSIFRGTQLVASYTSPNVTDVGYYGASVATLHNPDGNYDELIVAAPRETVGESTFDAGHVYVMDPTNGNVRLTITSPNAQTGQNFGDFLASLPDVTGDGRDDIAISASFESVDGVENAGRVYVFNGATGALVHTIVSPNPFDVGVFGRGMSTMSDVDGDGRGDLLIGAAGEVDLAGEHRAGRAYIYSGATGQLTTPVTTEVLVDSLLFGSESGAENQDVNQDGVVDVADLVALLSGV